MSDKMLTLEAFEEASEIVKKVTLETKLVYSDYLSRQTGNKVYLKPENMQFTGAYKVRGAYYKMSTLSEEERQKGLITASAGNHAQGVAYAAKCYGAGATIVMPTTTPLMKVTRTKSYGAEVVLYGDVYDEACAHALELAAEHGYTFIHPFDDEAVVDPPLYGRCPAAKRAGEETADDSCGLRAGGGRMNQNKRYIHIGILLTILAVLCSVNEKYTGTDKSETAPVCDITNTTIEDLKTALKERREKMENRIDKERLLFEKYKDSLYGLEEDSTRLAVLGENGWEQTEGCYREILWESFYGQSIITDTGLDSEDPEDMWGVLILEKPQPNLTGMRAAMYEMGSVTEYVYFDNWDIIWFARRGGSKKEREVPEYQVCEGVLNCAGVTLTGREERWDEWMESYGQEVSGEWEEYCVADGHVYRLDLENRRLLDVTEGIESCMAQWLTWEAERAVCGMQTEPMDVEMIRSMLPEEYRMSDRERITGCDPFIPLPYQQIYAS